MKLLSNITIAQKLYGYTGVVLLLFAVCGVVAHGLIASIESSQQELLQRVAQVRSQGDLDMMHDAVRGDVLAALLAAQRASATSAKQAAADYAEHAQRARERAGELRAFQLDAASVRQRDKVIVDLEAYLQAAARVIAAAAEASNESARDTAPEFYARFEQTEQSFGAFSERIGQLAAHATDAAARRVQRARRLAIATGVLALLLLPLLAHFIARGIVQPLHAAVEATQRVANGDLTHDVVSSTRDEAGWLLHELRQMTKAMRKTVGAVRDGAFAMSTNTQQIDVGGTQLSQRSSERAATLGQIASAFEQISATVKQSAQHTHESARFAREVAGQATRGGEVIHQAVAKISALAQSATKIADVTGVIDAIAFQTNILALNAAVEAARAGQSGRGFAVVAGEVRSLAARCAAASKEINQLISDSTRNVTDGNALVAAAGETMREIVGKVRDLSDAIGQVSSGAAQQAVGIGQVQQGITQLETLVQSDLALVEATAAAVRSLREQSGEFTDLVSVFKLPQGQNAALLATGA